MRPTIKSLTEELRVAKLVSETESRHLLAAIGQRDALHNEFAVLSQKHHDLTNERNALTTECDNLRQQIRTMEATHIPRTQLNDGAQQRVPTARGLMTREAAEELAQRTHRQVVRVLRFGRTAGFKVA